MNRYSGRTPVCLLLGTLLVLAVLFFLTSLMGSRPPVNGTVVDPAGPAEGVRVRFQGEAVHAVSDAQGRFDLPHPVRRRTRITAWLEGYFIGGGDARDDPLTLQLRPLPTQDSETYQWIDPTPDITRPQNCGNCHGDIYREWLNSGHARSATGRHFRNLFDGSDWQGRPNRGWSLLADHPDGAGVCTACHGPTVSFTEPAYFDLREVEGVAAQGVHCDYCHKISGTAGEVGVTHGRFGLRLLRPAEGQLFFGPLDDVDRGEDAYLPLYRRSRYCASCHEGTVFGVHVYSTYSEWQESPARRQGLECQSCHLKPTGRMTNVAPGHGGIERDPHTLGNHRFFAGSIEDMLRDCLRLSVKAERTDDAIEATVLVEAQNVGHRVPTGFIDRHLVLLVDAQGMDNVNLQPLSGPQIQGRAGKLYAKLLKEFDGQRPAPFWRADPDAEDTRLRPGEVDRVSFRFPIQVGQVRVRLVYRRFWPEVAERKGWPDNEIVVSERTCTVR